MADTASSRMQMTRSRGLHSVAEDAPHDSVEKSKGGGARYCKKCKEVFYGAQCRAGHANFMYTRRIPPEITVGSSAEQPRPAAPAPAPVAAKQPAVAAMPAEIRRAVPARRPAAVAASVAPLPAALSPRPAAAAAAVAPLPTVLTKRVIDARNPAALLSTPKPAVVTTQLTLSGSLVSVAGSDGSIKRRNFERHFVADVAAALSVAGPPVADSQIRIIRIAAGSVIVTFEVRAGTSGVPVSQSHISAAFATVVALPTVGVSTSGPPTFPSLADLQAWPGLERASKPAQPATKAAVVHAVDDTNNPAMTRSRHPSLIAVQSAHKARNNWWRKVDGAANEARSEETSVGARGGSTELHTLAEEEEDEPVDLADSPLHESHDAFSPGEASQGEDAENSSPQTDSPVPESDDAVIVRMFASHRRRTITAMKIAEVAMTHKTHVAVGAEREARIAAEKHVAHCEAHDDHIDHEIEQTHREIAVLSAEADTPKEAVLPSPERHALFSQVDLRNDSETYRDPDATPDWQVDSPSFAEHSEVPVSTQAGASSDHLTVHVATWNLGNAAPPEHLNRWLPRRGAGADIVMVAIQEGTYSNSVAKESVCGTAYGALLGAIGSWKTRLKAPLDAARCVAQVSLISEGQAKQAKQMRDVLAGPLHEPTAWSETFSFDLYPSSQRLLVQIIEPGNFGSGGTRAECMISLEEGCVIDGPEQGCRLVADDDGSGRGCTYELDLLCPSRGSFLGHCEIQLSLAGGQSLAATDGSRSRSFTTVSADEAAARAKQQRADHLKHVITQQLGSPYVLRPDLHGSLGEMRLMVFIRSIHVQNISRCEFKTQTTGLLGGRLPNKGGLVAKLFYKQTSLCFVCTHLEAHEGFGHCQGRNEMARRVQEGARVGDTQLDLGNQFDHVFWAGDLNYRVDLARFKADTYEEASFEEKWDEVAHMITDKQFKELQKYEELGKEIAMGNVFTGFTDAMLYDSQKTGRYFAPTFKVVRHKRGEYIKKRIPSYCDRVLWASMDGSEACIHLQGMSSDPSLTTSDHKPVYARYRLAIPKPLAELQTWDSDSLSSRNRPISMVVVRIANLRCQGISQKGCFSLALDPKDIQKCKPVVVVKGVGELADRVPEKVISKVAKRGSAHFKGKMVIPLEGASTPNDLLQTIESPANPEQTVEHSLAITLTVLDAAGHKHPIHGAVCGHSALALRMPAYEESVPLTKQSAQEHRLKSPAGFTIDYSQHFIRRDFISTLSLNGQSRQQGNIAGTIELYTIKELHGSGGR